MNPSNTASSSRERLRTIACRAMMERGMHPDFPSEALLELVSLTQTPLETHPSIRDLRTLLWCSIDNDESRDLDQLTVARTNGNDSYTLLVAIADVDTLVKKGVAIDQHARHNTSTVYTPAIIFPMLPEALSTDKTSLGENQERIALVVELTVTPEGNVTGSELYRAKVANQAQLAYDDVADWLDGESPAPPALLEVSGLDEQLRLQERIAQALRKQRHQRGALSLETHENKVVFDGDALADLCPTGKNRAKEIISDFMVAANSAVARYLDAQGFPSLRRILRVPKRWDRIVALAKNLGTTLPPEPDAPALEAFLIKQRKAAPEKFADLSLSVVKLLGAGEYVAATPGQHSQGHFGLAARDYAHSTAPNRRFIDLVTQRLAKAAIAGEMAPYTIAELEAIARHCMEQEGNVTKVERQVEKAAAALLLAPHIGKRFDAIVTGAAEKGTWVRIAKPSVQGKVIRGFQGLDVGDRIQVELVATDPEQGFIDFACVS